MRSCGHQAVLRLAYASNYTLLRFSSLVRAPRPSLPLEVGIRSCLELAREVSTDDPRGIVIASLTSSARLDARLLCVSLRSYHHWRQFPAATSCLRQRRSVIAELRHLTNFTCSLCSCCTERPTHRDKHAQRVRFSTHAPS